MPAGAPTKYRPEMCERIIELMREGCSKVQICADLGIAKPTFYEWVNPEHGRFQEDFKAAVDEGMLYAQAFWEEELKKAALGRNKDANATLMIYNMKNRFKEDWSDVQRVDTNVNFAQVSDTPVNSDEWLKEHKPK